MRESARMTKRELRREILAAYRKVGESLGADVTDAMAVPAYFPANRASLLSASSFSRSASFARSTASRSIPIERS